MSAMDTALSALPPVLFDFFGQPMIYSPVGGTAVSIVGILTDPPPPESNYPGNYALLDIFLSDLVEAPKASDQVTIGSIDYTIVDHKVDSLGMARITLQRNA